MLTLETPTKLRIVGLDIKPLETALTYVNKAKLFELNRLKKSPYFVNTHGEERYQEELTRLKAESRVCLLKEDEYGHWTYSGLKDRIVTKFVTTFSNLVKYPDPKIIPWSKLLPGEDRYYQKIMHDNLLAIKHGAVEVGTGLGKSRVILNLAKTLGLKTVVLAPTLSIGNQLLKDFVTHLGKAKVGFYGNGKKEAGKLVTVATYQSLARLEEGSDDWVELSKAQVFIVDESHLTPAATLKQVCEGVCGAAPYRFFFSGTQMRNDGADLLLEGIIGPVVYEMTVQQGVDEGYLSKPNFIMIEMDSPSGYISPNPDYMLDRHFYSNVKMYERAAEIANKSAELLGHQVLILIDEVNQFQHLYPFLRQKFGFAHSGVSKKFRPVIPKEYWKADVDGLVETFNAGNLPILIGTSCISIGTDIRTPKTVINLQGGLSEPKIRQAVGRGTRRENGVKEEFNYWDFCIKVRNPVDPDFMAITHRHALERAAIYRDIYPSLRFTK